MSPAMPVIPATPALGSASPLIAWMDTGMSRTFWALSLLAVTTISFSEEESAAPDAWACTASGRPIKAAMAAPAANIGLDFLYPAKCRPLISRIAHPPVIEQIQYELSYEISSQCKSVARGRQTADSFRDNRAAAALGYGARATQRSILRLIRRSSVKAVASSPAEKPFTRRRWRRRTTMLSELNNARHLSVRNTST